MSGLSGHAHLSPFDIQARLWRSCAWVNQKLSGNLLQMNKLKKESPIDRAADILRDAALTIAEGELLGSENEIVEKLDVSRVTVRQAARLLEQEGLLIVKRGKGGGYFAARPTITLLENMVCTYLETLGITTSHTGSVATALWVEALREAASADRSAASQTAEILAEIIEKIGPTATMHEVAAAEHAIRSTVFDLIDGGYMKTIFQINAAYARRHIPLHGAAIDEAVHFEFVRKWKAAKLLQCEAIRNGDVIQAVLAAIQDRNVWNERGSGQQAWHATPDG